MSNKKASRIKLNLNSHQTLLLVDELEAIKTTLSIKSDDFDLQIQCISNLYDYFPNTNIEKLNDKLEYYEKQYKQYLNKYDVVHHFALKVCKKDKLSFEELRKLLLLLEEFSNNRAKCWYKANI